jgi:hypothetical protein
MTSEISLQIAAQQHQTDLLEEAANRRLARTAARRPDERIRTTRRLQTLLRRLAGEPTFG